MKPVYIDQGEGKPFRIGLVSDDDKIICTMSKDVFLKEYREYDIRDIKEVREIEVTEKIRGL